jgi:hypothetical protein
MVPAPLDEPLVFNPSLIQSISKVVLPVPALKATPKLLLKDVPPGQFALLLGALVGANQVTSVALAAPAKRRGAAIRATAVEARRPDRVSMYGENQKLINYYKRILDYNGGHVAILHAVFACLVDSKQSPATQQHQIRRNSCRRI